MVKRYRRFSGPLPIGEGVYDLLGSMGGRPGRDRLASLWENWQEALGDDLAEMAVPLGSRGRTLLVGAPDAMQLQELHYMGEELLERVNTYIGNTYFENIRLGLSGCGKFCAIAPEQKKEAVQTCKSALLLTGEFLAFMDMTAPVALCYARFAARGR